MTANIATKIFAIFTQVGEWLGTAIPSFSNIFWDATNSEWDVLSITSIPTSPISGKVKVELGELEDNADKIKYGISIA
jgi:hypothetical protein